jgi:hypothetical protein
MKRWLFLAVLLFGFSAYAQNPQTSTAPIFRTNSAWVNGSSIGYYPTKGTGLTLNVGAGSAWCSGTLEEFAGGTLSLANNATVYVFLDSTSACNPASNTTAFGAANIPIAKVTTSGGVITAIDDARTPFSTGSAGGTGLVSLDGLTSTTQSFSTGTAGTDFGISSAGSVHTFNLPVADATHTGKLSSTDWTTFNNKQSAISVAPPITITSGVISINGQGTTTTVLHGNASGAATFGAVDLNTDTTGILGVLKGGTGASTFGGSFDALLVATGSSSSAWYQINGGSSCGDSSHATSYNATTHLFGCQSITGAGTPGGASGTVQYNNSSVFGGITDWTTNGTTTLTGASGAVLDMNAASSLRIPNAAGATTATNGFLAYDTTNNNVHAGATSADSVLPTVTVTPATGNCVKWLVSSGRLKLDDAGAACGTGSGTVTGTGTSNNLTKWTGSTAIGNAGATDDGTTFAITDSKFLLPVAASLTTTTSGLIGVDSTNNNLHVGLASADSIIPSTTVTPTNGNCVKWAVTSNRLKLDDAGAACGTTGVTSSAVVSTTGSNASVGSTNIVATTVAATTAYTVKYHIYQDGAGSGCTGNAQVSVSINWTDPSSTAQSLTSAQLFFGNSIPAGVFARDVVPIVAKSSTSITYTTTYTAGNGCTTNPTYAVYLWAEQP